MSTQPAPAARSPREVLAAYSEKAASFEQVMRALTEHDDWYVPIDYALHHMKIETTVFENLVMFSDRFEADPSILILFTDRVAAARAEGNRIGAFAGGMRGSRVFTALTDGVEKVSVNPCSPKAESWYINR